MKNNKGISLISVIIAILLMAILVVLIWVGIAVMNSSEEENGNKVIAKDGQTDKINEEDFEDMLIEYILDSIEVYSTSGYLLKDMS